MLIILFISKLPLADDINRFERLVALCAFGRIRRSADGMTSLGKLPKLPLQPRSYAARNILFQRHVSTS